MHRAGGQKDASIGIFYPTLCTDIGWGTCAAALLRVSGELVAAIAMECYDMDGGKIWNKLGRRFMEGENTDLLRDLQSLLRGTIQATVWMHKSGLAHGDLKDSNMLFKIIKETPNDSRIAWCAVEHTKYQIVFGDWGNARWSWQTEKAFHTFAPIRHGGQEYCTTNIIDAVNDRDQISPVNARELNSAFGLLLKKPTRYRHPGAGTALFCCPDIQRVFKPGDGVVQRRFDQAADMWALGVLGVCLLAPPGFEQTGQKTIRDVDWAERLKQASRVAEKQLKAERSSGAQLGGKAMQATLQPEDCGSWIATMVRRHYQQDRWPILSDRLSGEHKSEWQSWLALLHGLLTYSSKDRLKANDALENPFFFMSL
jgi:serine/threonine protein kinase